MKANARTLLSVLALVVSAVPASALGQVDTSVKDRVVEAPEDLAGVTVTEKLGATVPTDVRFVDDQGREVVFGDYLDEQPVILTFNYSDCPMLCSTQLQALTASLKKISLVAGRQFRIVTITLDDTQTVESSADAKAGYVSQMPEAIRDEVASGWTFLTGDRRAINALANAVGFGYRYLPERKEYAHPATLIFLSSKGRVTRYFHGLDYGPEALRQSIFKAGTDEPEDSLGFILSCFHYDSKAGSYAQTGERTMRYGAIGFVVLMLAAFGLWQLMRARRARAHSS